MSALANNRMNLTKPAKTWRRASMGRKNLLLVEIHLESWRASPPADEAGEVPEHRDVDDLRPRAQAADGEGVRELLLEAFHASSLSRTCDLEEAMTFEPIAAPAHSAAERLWFNDALQLTKPAQAMELRI